MSYNTLYDVLNLKTSNNTSITACTSGVNIINPVPVDYMHAILETVIGDEETDRVMDSEKVSF